MKLGLKSEPVPCDCVILADVYHWWLCKCRGCKISKQITGAPMAGGGPALAVAGFVGTHTEMGLQSRLIPISHRMGTGVQLQWTQQLDISVSAALWAQYLRDIQADSHS